MKVCMFTIHDVAADVFQTPFSARAKGEAIRIFSDLVNDNSHPVGQHPDHYTLFEIGEYDMNSAELIPTEPMSLGNGVEFTRPDPA